MFVWGVKLYQCFLSWCSQATSSELVSRFVLMNRDSRSKNPSPLPLPSRQTWVASWEGSCDSLAFLRFLFYVADKHTRSTEQTAGLSPQPWLAGSLRFLSDSLRILFSVQTVSSNVTFFPLVILPYDKRFIDALSLPQGFFQLLFL